MNWFEHEVHQGELRGELKGERKVLLKQLRRRFGDVPAGVVARIEAAEVADLEIWADRFVTASRLEEVLGAASSDSP